MGRIAGLGPLAAMAALFLSGSAPAQEAPAIEIDLALSERAAERLAAEDEGITLWISYYGWPGEDARAHADEVGEIDLGAATIQLPAGPERIRLSAEAILPDRLGWLEGPLRVLVNVYSSRRSGPDNILSCDIIDAEVPLVIAAGPVTIDCALIEEGAETRIRP